MDHIAADPYLSYWNETIFGNATDWYNDEPVVYFFDGGNGILDIARQFKQRAKAFSYAYRMTNDTKWADRLWVEIQVSLHVKQILFTNSSRSVLRMSLVIIRLPLVRIMTAGTLIISSTRPNFPLVMVSPTTGYTTSGPTTRRLLYVSP